MEGLVIVSTVTNSNHVLLFLWKVILVVMVMVMGACEGEGVEEEAGGKTNQSIYS